MRRSVGAWTVAVEPNPRTERLRIVVEGPSWTDYPIRYPDGRIAYNFPERVPAYVKRAVERVMVECDIWSGYYRPIDETGGTV